MGSALDRIDVKMQGVLWAGTAKEKPFSSMPLEADKDVDLVVVGAGFAGLTIARYAAKAGLSVVVLEAGIVGVGASGRTGGYAVPHFPGAKKPSDVEKLLGKKKADKLISLVAGGPTWMFDEIERYQIACDPLRKGWAQPAHSQKAMAKVKAVFDEWKALGQDVEWIEGADVKATLGASGYLGAWRNPTGGAVQPFALCLGLARAATQEGAVIHEKSPVTRVRHQDGKATVQCNGHVATAKKVVIATNGYTDPLTPNLEKSGIAVRLFHCATEPLSEEVLDTILPQRTCFTDLRKSGGFCRCDPDGRIISGGAVFSVPGAEGYGLGHARKRMYTLFPELERVNPKIETYWEGYCSITDSYLPSFQVVDRDIFSLIGFSTRGVALAQTMGKIVGEFAADQCTLDDIPLEVVEGTRSISMHGVKERVGRLIFPYYQAMDRFGLS
ncbi:NAD(P)/FAD-dependent oxidoreductase [Rhodobium gokarnense]|uniref:Glycine/D-amino acid oxidase-like deaminating enzyme n=1 Tax=Rhodobium gokarnense TaxID=364296 RepID=A0ABT3H6T5_9HYPH|nr:FAD-dependent oxidoreductase [Rhodobium gokarnense]MCW2306105.1 glycine/D-amino acid oxidase-like deaminating enzyme [Rhodobium gokarnense]